MEKSKKHIKITAVLLTAILLYSGLLLFLYQNDNKYTQKCTRPIQGILCLTEDDLSNDQVVFIARQWQYYPDVLLSPADFQELSPTLFMQYVTTGQYNDFSMGKLSRSPYGCATYRMILELPEQAATYSLALPEIYSAYRLYINGENLLTLGDPQLSRSGIGRRVVDFCANGTTEIIISASNYSHYYSGMTSPPAFGYSTSVRHMTDKLLFMNSAVAILILLLGLFSIYLGLRVKLKKANFYALLCFCLLFHLDYPLTSVLFTSGTRLWYILELVSIYVFYVLLVHLQNFIFDTKSRLYHPMCVMLGLFCILTLGYAIYPTSNAIVHTIFSTSVVIIKLLTAAYLMWNALLAARGATTESYLLLGATALFSVSLLADRIFPFYEAIYGGFFYEYGGFILILTLGYILWRDVSEAYRFKKSFENEKRRLTMQVAMQKSHYGELTEQIAEAAKQRHDLRHHLRTIYTFLLDNDVENAIDYLSDCDVSRIQPPHTPICDNLIIDAILQYYKTLSDDSSIQFHCAVELPAELPMEDTDISILFGNLLENAYEACKDCDLPEPQISVVGKYKDTGLFLRIENTFTSGIKKRGSRFLSSRHDGFGIGTESVKAIVSQYNGLIDFEHENTLFRVSVMLSI